MAEGNVTRYRGGGSKYNGAWTTTGVNLEHSHMCFVLFFCSTRRCDNSDLNTIQVWSKKNSQQLFFKMTSIVSFEDV
jgi:hypothetical protein